VTLTSKGIEELYEEFQARKRSAWLRGRAEYRQSDADSFFGDAAHEAAEEVVDFSNYVDQLALEGRISEEERIEIEIDSLNKFVWLDGVRNRRNA